MKKWQKTILVVSVLSVLFVTMIVPSFAIGNNTATGSGGPDTRNTVESTLSSVSLVYDWHGVSSDEVSEGLYYYELPVSDYSPYGAREAGGSLQFVGRMSSIIGDYPEGFDDFGGNDISVAIEENVFDMDFDGDEFRSVTTYYAIESEVRNYNSDGSGGKEEINPFVSLKMEELYVPMFSGQHLPLPSIDCAVYGEDIMVRFERSYTVRFATLHTLERQEGALSTEVVLLTSAPIYLSQMLYYDDVSLNGEWQTVDGTGVGWSLRYPNSAGGWTTTLLPASFNTVGKAVARALKYVATENPAFEDFSNSTDVLISADYTIRPDEVGGLGYGEIETLFIAQTPYERYLFNVPPITVPIEHNHYTAEVSPFEWIIEAGQSALSFEIIPGFEIGDILLIALAVPILLAILRAIAGG